ncbi:BAG family molecular chaperone regulator 3 [Bienertia sinuspersici]
MMKKTNINNNNINVGKMGGREWEMRPGGMLVQKRNLDSHKNTSIPFPFPTIKVFVKFGSSYHEIHINSHSTFGELKKSLAEVTGLHPQDQKLFFNDKERESKSFLNDSGVKNGSTIVLVQDNLPEKRFTESRRSSTTDRALKSVAEVAMEVDKLVCQITSMESVIYKGGSVTEKELLALIELFMAQLIKLDGIVADGDVKLKRKTQVIRIQKYMENLDRLKARNAIALRNGGNQVGLNVSQSQQQGRPLIIQQQREQRKYSGGQVMMTSKWEKY